jgi:hypothetical protein
LKERLALDIHGKTSLVKNKVWTVHRDLEGTAAVGNVEVVKLQFQLKASFILKRQGMFSAVVLGISIDNGKFALAEDSILQINAEQEKMRQFNNVDWAHTTLPQEVCPILLGILVVNAVLEIVWQKVLNFHGSKDPDPHVGVHSGKRIFAVIGGIDLEVEWRGLLSTLTDTLDSSSGTTNQVFPE